MPALTRTFKPTRYQLWLAAAFALLVGLGGLAATARALAPNLATHPWSAMLAFACLSFLVQRSSSHLGMPSTHSLSGAIDLAAVLAFGPAPGACVAAASGLAYLGLAALRGRRFQIEPLVLIPLFDAGLKAGMSLAVGGLFFTLNGGANLTSVAGALAQDVSWRTVGAVGAACLAWFTLDHLGWGIWEYLAGGWKRLRLYFRSAFPEAFLVGLLPLLFCPILALVYQQLFWLAFVLMALAIAGAALIVQRWADARIELTQRVAELSTLEQVGRAIAQAQFDVDQLCLLLYEETSHIADTTIFHVGLFDGDDYVIKLWMREGEREAERTFQLERGVGLVNWMRESKQPLLVHDLERERHSLPARPVYVADRPPRSALFVPLRAGEAVIGTLSIQSYRPHAYSQNDLRVVSAIANQAAVAILKAQLYEQERKRARQLDTIGQVVRQVSATLKLEDLIQQAVRLIRKNFGYYHVGIFTADRQTQSVTFQASASAGQRNIAFDVAWGEGLIGWVAARATSAIANDVALDPRYRSVDALDETRAEMAVPLRLEEELVGVLDVQSDRTEAFSADDLFILETLGAQVAIAIQKARLYEGQQQQAWLSTALLQVADALSHLSDMDEVLSTIVRLTPMLVGVDHCGILLLGDDGETFLPAQAYGLSPEHREEFEQLAFAPGDLPALDLVRQERTPLLIGPLQSNRLLPGSLAALFQVGEMALLPLIAQGELLGTLLADLSGRAQPPNERMMTILTGIANQAAMVIQAARLLQAQQEEAYVSIALLQVADAVSRSTELSEAMAAVVRLTPLLVGVEACTVFLWNTDAAAFLPYQQHGLAKDALPRFWELRFGRGVSPARELMEGKPYVAVQNSPELTELAAALGQGTLLILPIAVRGEVVGLMSLDCSLSLQRITERRMGILTGIAGQAGIAVETNRLHEEAAEQERMRGELEVAKRIQMSFLPECCPQVPGWELASVWRSAREVAGDFYDFIPIQHDSTHPPSLGRTGVVIADVADKGVPAALFMALSRTLLRTMAIGGRSPSTAVAQTNHLILADTRSELFVTLFYTILEPDSGEITYVNAGQPPPLLVRIVDGELEELRTGGMALGVSADEVYEEKRANLEPGDALVLYTDGIVEASDVEGRMFGRTRLRDVVRLHRAQPADLIAAGIMAAVDAFVGGAAQFDDLTLVVVKRQPSEAVHA